MLTKPYKLVIVEDDFDVCQVLTDYIEDLYPDIFSIRTFQEPGEALDAINKNPAHMVISDLKMPGKYGDTLLNEIRNSNSGVISIIITGYPSFSVMASAFRDGIHAFLIKPFDEKDVSVVIDPCLALLTNWEAALQKYLENKNI